jgi:hypothetical protein
MTRSQKNTAAPAAIEAMVGAGPSSSDEGKGVTIHPRITSDQSRAGSLVARQRGQRPMTFWSEVVAHGLAVAAALGVPDEQDMYGPWSGKRLARLLRMTVAQLIEFQIQHGEVPAILELLQRQSSPISSTPASLPHNEVEQPGEPEVFAATASRKEVQQGLAGVGFGQLSILGKREEVRAG